MSDKKELEKSEDSSVDPELDDLLNSALEDFSKKPKEEGKSKDDVSSKKDEATGNSASEGDTGEKTDVEWSDEFIKHAAAQFESNIQNLLTNTNQNITTEQLQQNFQKMAEAAAQVIANPSGLETNQQSNDFAATISQTLQNLSLGTENLQNPFSEQNIMNMFGNESEGGNAFLPFMQGMMQSLLSKEVLYPSLKDILDRYPAWLEENTSKLEQAEVERYTKQMDLMKNVCTELEQEREDDPDNIKRERFDRVLQLMQTMQDLGHPPTELVGDNLGTGIQFDEQGNPVLPTDPNQCLLM